MASLLWRSRPSALRKITTNMPKEIAQNMGCFCCWFSNSICLSVRRHGLSRARRPRAAPDHGPRAGPHGGAGNTGTDTSKGGCRWKEAGPGPHARKFCSSGSSCEKGPHRAAQPGGNTSARQTVTSASLTAVACAEQIKQDHRFKLRKR